MTIENSLQLVENKADKPNHDVEYDNLLSSAGELGRYQWRLFFSTCPFFAFGVFVYYSQMFMTEVSPNHWCWIPELTNMSDVQRRNLGIPNDEKSRFGYSQCEMYDVNWTDVLGTGYKFMNQSWKIVSCQHGWEFNKSEIPYPTIGSEFEWVCEKNSYQATAQAIFFIGCVFGCLTCGWIADRFGRIPAIITSCLLGSIGGFTSTFARNFVEFTAARFVMGMSYDTCMVMAYLLILEFIGPKYRTLLANLAAAIYFSLFLIALPWIALACGHWKTISLVTSLPLTFGLLTKLFLPESPMWLLSKGRGEEVINKIQAIGRINGKEVPSESVTTFKQSIIINEEEEHHTLLAIIRRPVLRKVFILICLECMCCSIVYDGLVRSIGQLEFDFFVSFSIVSVSELPSVIIVAFIMNPLGRQWLCIVFITVSCLSCFMIIFVEGVQTVVLAFIARFALNMANSAVMQWGPELLPTAVRASGVAVIHICGFVVSFLCPYIVYLKVYVYWLPQVIMSIVAGIGMVIALLLPDTTLKGMPHTFEDAEELTRNQSLWTLPFLEDRRKRKINACKRNCVGEINSSFS